MPSYEAVLERNRSLEATVSRLQAELNRALKDNNRLLKQSNSALRKTSTADFALQRQLSSQIVTPPPPPPRRRQPPPPPPRHRKPQAPSAQDASTNFWQAQCVGSSMPSDSLSRSTSPSVMNGIENQGSNDDASSRAGSCEDFSLDYVDDLLRLPENICD
ncbi:hypothetical protein WJX74_007545 [Apatococcus lobatus]|uniref:Uncharacterized protein n=1 Tax=Apatococcus lobatus TaxID=904363 RepID=A0AAW1QXI2_9CHLO